MLQFLSLQSMWQHKFEAKLLKAAGKGQFAEPWFQMVAVEACSFFFGPLFRFIVLLGGLLL